MMVTWAKLESGKYRKAETRDTSVETIEEYTEKWRKKKAGENPIPSDRYYTEPTAVTEWQTRKKVKRS